MNLPSPKTLQDRDSRSTSYKLEDGGPLTRTAADAIAASSSAHLPDYDDITPAGKMTPASSPLQDADDAGGGGDRGGTRSKASIPRGKERVRGIERGKGRKASGIASPRDHGERRSDDHDEERESMDIDAERADGQGPPPSRWSRIVTRTKRHAAFIGPGIVASVGYTDPGNWVTDLSAGSQFGYALLFVVLLSGLVGILLQILAVRMGAVTGHDLAKNSRLLFLPENKTRQELSWYKTRVATVWLLYLVSEGAIIATELAELIGSAVALNLLFPRLPLWGGVIITSADVLLILFVYRPSGNFRILEILIAGLVMVVLACYIALLVRTKPHWPTVFHGYIPSSTLVEPDALYAGIGIVGAVIMPHSLFLGSHFSTIDRLRPAKIRSEQQSIEDQERAEDEVQAQVAGTASTRLGAWIRLHLLSRFPSIDASSLRQFSFRQAFDTAPSSTAEMVPPGACHSIESIRLHLPHASWDIAISLVFFAITVNSAILIVAGAAFYYNQGSREVGDLYDAYSLLSNTLGNAYAILFAIALLAAGQSASITVTLAGQIVSEGFINWRTNPFIRRLVTRVITIIPALAIATAVGKGGLNQALEASQVALSFALPFVLVPLILVTALPSFMTVKEDSEHGGASQSFTNHWLVTSISIVAYVAILLADVYTLVTTIMGKQ